MTTNESGRRHPAAKIERSTAIVGGPADTDAEGWRADAEDAVLRLAAVGVPFGADEVRALGVAEPPHPNHWGPVFSALHRAGYLVPTGYTTSARRPRHCGVQALWTGTAPAAEGPDADAVRAVLVEDRRRAVRARVDALGRLLDAAPLPALACVAAALDDVNDALDALGVRDA